MQKYFDDYLFLTNLIRIILGNDLAKRVFDLETKLKEFALERQKVQLIIKTLFIIRF